MVTIVMPISRTRHLDKIFYCFEQLLCDRKNTNLLTIVDGNLQVFEKARNLTQQSKFEGRLCVYRNKGLPSDSNIDQRRQRIAEIHNEASDLINPCDYVLLVEDDTLFPANGLAKLIRHYMEHPHAGIISGIELGRHGWLHIGGWEVDNIYEPKTITSVERSDTLQPLDATGFYFGLTKFDNYQRHNFKPFEQSLGPDFQYGLTLRQQGLQNYMDQTIHCTHLTPKEDIQATIDSVRVRLTRNQASKTGWIAEQIRPI